MFAIVNAMITLEEVNLIADVLEKRLEPRFSAFVTKEEFYNFKSEMLDRLDWIVGEILDFRVELAATLRRVERIEQRIGI